MKDDSMDIAAILSLQNDSDYYDLDETTIETLKDNISAMLFADDSDEETAVSDLLAIGAPKQIVLSNNGNVSVLIGSVSSAIRKWRVNPESNLMLLLKNNVTGELSVVSPNETGRRMPATIASSVGEPPQAPMSNIMSIGVDSRNISTVQGLELTAGTWTVTAINYDMLSNTVLTEVIGNPPTSNIDFKLPSYIKTYTSDEPILESRVKVFVNVNEDVNLRVALAVNDEVAIVKDDTGQTYIAANIIITSLDNPPTVAASVLPTIIHNESGNSLYNSVFEANLNSICTASRCELGSMVYIELGSHILGPYSIR